VEVVLRESELHEENESLTQEQDLEESTPTSHICPLTEQQRQNKESREKQIHFPQPSRTAWIPMNTNCVVIDPQTLPDESI
jgi:hypothetical protein